MDRWTKLAELHGIPEPPLRTGDRMRRTEYAAIYEHLPDEFLAQLIEGVVYRSGPVTVTHGTATARFIGWIWYYAAYTPGTSASSRPTTQLDDLNEPEPDAVL